MATPVLKEPWLVAAWPGMGAVAILAAETLVNRLGAERIAEPTFDDWFDVNRVTVDEGVLVPAPRPKGFLFAWKNPDARGHDLLVFLAEAQPEVRQWAYCDALLDKVGAHGVKRVVTFAAMASPTEPSEPARVFAAATARVLLEPLPEEIVRMNDGEIGGLNGLLVAAAAGRGMEGLCLLGEFPFFATRLANPKASAAVLRAFAVLAGISLDLRALDLQAKKSERQLEQLLGKMREEQAKKAEGRGEEEGEAGFPADFTPEEEEEPAEEPPRVAESDRRHIEQLFVKAAADRNAALALKAELDRLGLFKQYEDRFLDLFRRGE